MSRQAIGNTETAVVAGMAANPDGLRQQRWDLVHYLDEPAKVDGDIPASASPFPERRIVSFGHRQDFFVFFSMLNDLVHPDHVVVDLGAGRGRSYEFGGPHLRYISGFRGRCRRLIGLDVDPVVKENPYLDEALMIGADGRFPLADESVDLIFSFAVVEHVADPEALAREVRRVLKPGGRFCAWTPNKWGYIAIGARLIPNKMHTSALKVVEPNNRAAEDVFPALYRLNTLRAVRRYFPDQYFQNQSFYFNGLPVYNFNRPLIAWILTIYMTLTPPVLAQGLFIFLRKLRVEA